MIDIISTATVVTDAQFLEMVQATIQSIMTSPDASTVTPDVVAYGVHENWN